MDLGDLSDACDAPDVASGWVSIRGGYHGKETNTEQEGMHPWRQVMKKKDGEFLFYICSKYNNTIMIKAIIIITICIVYLV